MDDDTHSFSVQWQQIIVTFDVITMNMYQKNSAAIIPLCSDRDSENKKIM